MTAMAVPPSPGVIPNGAISANVAIFDPAVNKKLVRCYCYAYAAPRVDWNDGTAYQSMNLDVAGSGGAPNRYSLDHTYATYSAANYSVRVMGSSGQANQTLQIAVGVPPLFESDKRRLTQPERWALEAQKAKDIVQPSDEIGSDPGNHAAPGGTVKNPTTRQSRA